MNLKPKKRLAGKALGVSPQKVKFDPEQLDEVKEAITLKDIVSLIKRKIVGKKKVNLKSRGKIRKNQEQKKKGRRRGAGSRKGTANARKDSKETWMEKIRTQRAYIKNLKEQGKVDTKTYRMLYRRSKGGFFRSKRHINLYLQESVNKK